MDQSKFKTPAITGFQADAAAEQLGPLASWWMTPDALALINATAKGADDLESDSIGECWILAANKIRMDESSPMLRSGLLLPLTWKKATAYDPQLAAFERLREEADQVCEVFEALQLIREGDVGLYFSEKSLGQGSLPDLNGIFEPASGFPMLVAGLWSLITSSRLRSDVWATGCWDGDQFQDVGPDTLPAKLQFAADQNVTRFYLPESQIDAARALLPDNTAMEIAALKASQNSPTPARRVFAGCGRFFKDIGTPPSREAGPEALRNYFLVAFEGNKPAAGEFYRGNGQGALLQEVIATAEEKMPSTDRNCVVTVLSMQPELVLIARRLLRAKQLLILFTPDHAQIAEHKVWLEAALNEDCPDCEFSFREFRLNQPWKETVSGHIEDFRRVCDSRLTFDLTPGQKPVSMHLGECAAPNDQLFFLEHLFHAAVSVPDPFSETPRLWTRSATAVEKTGVTIDLSLQNEELYAACEIEMVGGKRTLRTPPADATNLIGANVHRMIDQLPAGSRDYCVLSGPMAIWSYLIVFHAVVHAFREVRYNDGRGNEVVVARHG